MKQSGTHWAIKAQIARRGGFIGKKILSTAREVDGDIQSLRDADALATKEKVDDNRTGGYVVENRAAAPPGLGDTDTPHPVGLDMLWNMRGRNWKSPRGTDQKGRTQ